MKILVIEDEVSMQEIVQETLEKELYVVESATTYQSALDKIISFDYDCILLDIMLPDGSGFDILKELKRLDKASNVIIISAKNSIEDKVAGLNLGADDYLIKPFHIAELTARVKSVLRRKTLKGKNELEINNVKIQFEDRVAFINNEPIALNRKEFDVLAYFMVNKNRLINKTSLAEHVWGDFTDESDDFEFIYSQIKNLRKKLKDQQAAIEIQAVYGIGYKLIAL
ncbi:response regulator transcription factor [Cytophaga hutchinsonii]|uniref:Two-component system response regulator n=1 Tax=Cytophaga hutchinsonii (strain ATCC 33406 / DSM 1761 / CIP 103989 / NBRC 15051 / NCIMB 9469 / D465) TaxID=269798 RepID=A0A6N4SW43_CYTH3|nr:response regulator transcription factor [Cytophaga hutchinsonii]ABG60767.1 two-component system response regulator [Cytophaga hutchinsonii ATCC 33406]SFX71503.1 DNA-binding response regulator, OmpR family, contains REC and winged-helix (wHTH) domain [Cytophaga hutchinsonii ATCC 33406]